MKKSLVVMYVMLCINFMPMQSMQPKKPAYIPRGLLVFLDDSEYNTNKVGAVTAELVTALGQNAGPIIVSAALLFNIAFWYKNSLLQTHESLLHANENISFYKAQRANLSFEQLSYLKKLSNELYIYAVFKVSGFNPNQWVIKKINDALYLLLPYTALNNVQVDVISVNAYNPRVISTTEQRLGLKVNHMETITIDQIRQPQKYQLADYFMDAVYSSRNKTSAIFCMRSDYNSAAAQPLWSLYLAGHGTVGGIVVSMHIEQFKKWLNFLENKINTQLLAYLSCYAAGITSELLYKDSTSPLQKTYSFAVMTQALTEAPIGIGYTVGVARFGGETIITLGSSVQYDMFFREVAKSSEVVNYLTIAQYLFGPVINANWAYIPQIKLPGLEWFSVMDSRKEIVSIGSVLAKTWNPQKPFKVATFFKTDPKALLLHARDIPFELKIDSKNLEAIISMAPGDAVHRIEKISSTTKDVTTILDCFMNIPDMGVWKIFFISEMGMYKNIIVSLSPHEPPIAFLLDPDNVVYVKSRDRPIGIGRGTEDYRNIAMTMRNIESVQRTRPFESGITYAELENIKRARPKAVARYGRPARGVTEETIVQKRWRLKKALASYRIPHNPTMQQSILKQLSDDVRRKSVDINKLSDDLVEVYGSMFQGVAGKK